MQNELDEEVEYLEDIPGAIGYPHTVMPTSWFQVGWSGDLAPGERKPLKYWNKDLVIFRTQSGEAVLTSAFCPHLGAHLGHTSEVDGEVIRCLYHGWEWGTDGRNKMVPAEGCPSKTRRALRKYPVVETNGIIWAWHDELRRAPLWPAPEERRHERDYLPVHPHCTYLWENCVNQPQYVAENTVDIEHLIWVHKNKLLDSQRKAEDLSTMIEEGHLFKHIRQPPMQQTTVMGLGTVLVDFVPDEERPHRMPCLLFHSTTPIDFERSDMFGTLLIEQDKSAPGGDGIVPVGNAKKRIDAQMVQAGRDLPVWNHMVYVERPAYSRLEGLPFNRIRRWMKQFYPDSGSGIPTRQSTTVVKLPAGAGAED